ncbi:GNAT family N-acetyltransferase [Nodosilinea sp. LEGE 07088]|nr:GNAT family N-acetyltransferase [Nodosilinea sp. LEGE 07088]
MEIRPGEVTDSEAIAALLADLGYFVDPDLLTQNIRNQQQHPDATLLVAVDADTVVGVISLHFIPQLALKGDFCRISYFCVSPGTRGQGIGMALEAAATALAQARGCDRIEVHCHARRELAHQFYAGQGYTESPKYLIKPLTR